MANIGARKAVVFCDFDGTATEEDVIQMVLKAFAKEGWKGIVSEILDTRTLSIKDGIRQLFELLPGDKEQEIADFVLKNVKLREGFKEFLSFCNMTGIPFVVVSGGVDFLIEPILKPYEEKLSLYCNTGRFRNNRIELDLPNLNESCETCGQCACCKISVMDAYPKNEWYRIVIGDSLTDLAAAKQADWVFARSRLIDYAMEDGLSVTSFESFHDVQQRISDRLQEISMHNA